MKAIAKTEAASGVALIDLPEPSPGPDDVIFTPVATAICGSDLAIHRWSPWTRSLEGQLPFVLGHEVCGRVSAVGSNVTRVKVGERIAVETHIPCGHCWYCCNHRAHVCENMVLYGHEINGCFSETAVVHQNAVWRIESDIPTELATLMEPLGVALRGAEAVDLDGQPVAILGAGPIGLMVTAFATKMNPSSLIVIEPSVPRREIALEVGASAVLDPAAPGLDVTIRQMTGGTGVEVVIDCSGNAEAIVDSIRYTRVGGHLVLIGNPDRDLQLNAHRDIIHQELTIRGIWGRTLWDTWARVEQMIGEHADRLQRIVTARYALTEQATAFGRAFSGEEGKVLLLPSKS